MKELINSLIINKCKKSNIFDILMEFIFLILQGIVISHIYKLNKLNVSPPSRIIFFLFLIYIVCDTLLLILEYVKCEKISKFKLFRFSLINYMYILFLQFYIILIKFCLINIFIILLFIRWFIELMYLYILKIWLIFLILPFQ